MNIEPKKIGGLTIEDIKAFPVWQYLNDDSLGETAVVPVECLPVESLSGKVIGTQIKTANGTAVWALISNVDEHKPELNEHFLTISVNRRNQWFTLARYHDIDYEKHGPTALAAFLDLGLSEVFPISYDLREYVSGQPFLLAGKIPKEPRRQLTRDQLVAMALE